MNRKLLLTAGLLAGAVTGWLVWPAHQTRPLAVQTAAAAAPALVGASVAPSARPAETRIARPAVPAHHTPPASSTPASSTRQPTTPAAAPAGVGPCAGLPCYDGQPCTACTAGDGREGGTGYGGEGPNPGPLPAGSPQVTVVTGSGSCATSSEAVAAEDGLQIIPADECGPTGVYTPPPPPSPPTTQPPPVIYETAYYDYSAATWFEYCVLMPDVAAIPQAVTPGSPVNRQVSACPDGIKEVEWSSAQVLIEGATPALPGPPPGDTPPATTTTVPGQPAGTV